MQGNIARWLKKEGDKVSPGEVLCEVETVGLFLAAVIMMLLRECSPLCVLASGFWYLCNSFNLCRIKQQWRWSAWMRDI